MPIEGVDYSFSRPDPARLFAAGKRFAVRYFGTTSSGKNATRQECQALQAAGLQVVANYEGRSAGWMRGGRSVGEAAARAAHQDAVSCGMPPARPIYFSADWNATLDEYKTQIRPCLQGAAAVLGGPGRVGVYGSVYVVTWAMQDRVAAWGWGTYAWSFGQWPPDGQLRQYHNGVSLAGGTVDLCRAVTPDFGQWGSNQPEEDLSIVDDATQKYLDGKFDAIRKRDDQLALWIAGRANAAYNPDAIAARLEMEKVDFDTPTSPAALKTAFTSLMTRLNEGLAVTLDVSGLSADQLALVGKAAAGALVIEGATLKDGKLILAAATP